MLRFFIFALSALSPLIAFAQAKVDATRPIKIEYESKSWNKDPQNPDSAAVIMRDTKSRKVVRIQLEETGPNTNIFIGSYSVSWGESEVVPEMYIAPQEMIKTAEQLKRFETMIKEGVLLRKPYFVRSDEKSPQHLTVYDTKEQALLALEEYRRLRLNVQSPVGRAALEAQANVAKESAQKAQDLVAQKELSERQKLEEEERKKQEEMRAQQSKLANEEKARRQALAKQAADEAMNLFRQDKYAEAEAKFQKATELDPGNTTFYYQYGVTLYKNEKYNRSLVTLDLAQGAEINATEREYYKSLNYMKLKDLDPALKGFHSVKAKNDKSLSASAAFFAGVVEYQKEAYEAAKSDFEYTLDNSQDPALDKQSEAFIEQIANIMAFKKEQSKKFILTLNLGLMYDSNILSVSNSQLDQPTDLVGYRWTYGGILEYRPVYTIQHEFSAILSASDMYSTDQRFQPKQSFQNTDPLMFSLYLPYKYKGKAFEKPFQMTISPGYESIQMNADGNGARETIINSTVLKNDNTFVMRDDWFATYALELRNDRSLLDNSLTPADDPTATKITVSTAQTFFQNQKKTEAWIGELGASKNTAAGQNSTYTRFDLAATYMAPWKWDTAWTARLAYYNANYNEHAVGRVDSDTSLTLALRKPFSEHFSGGLTGVYTNNKSTLDTSDYNKYLIMTVFSWTGAL